MDTLYVESQMNTRIGSENLVKLPKMMRAVTKADRKIIPRSVLTNHANRLIPPLIPITIMV